MKIVQCWDDGVVDDIRLIEILRRHGAKASFNLNYGLHRGNRYAGWKYKGVKDVWKLATQELTAVYDGFTAANHSLTHPWLNQIPAAEAERDIREGKDALEQLFGYEIKGFAYPFGAHDETVEALVRGTGHVYARTTGVTDKVYPPANPMAFHPHCHYNDPLFWEKYAKAREIDGVFYFWGHSYEILTEDDWREIEAKIARLSAEPDAGWADLVDLFP